MSTERNGHTPRPWNKEPWVWLLVAFPAVAVIASFVTAYLAFSTDDGLVVDDYYRKGLAINRTLSRDHAASRLQLQATLRVSDNNTRVAVVVTGNPQFREPDTLQAMLFHGTRGGLDQTVVLGREGPGTYSGPLPTLAPGRWDLQLQADDWRLMGSITRPGDSEIRLGYHAPNL